MNSNAFGAAKNETQKKVKKISSSSYTFSTPPNLFPELVCWSLRDYSYTEKNQAKRATRHESDKHAMSEQIEGEVFFACVSPTPAQII